MAGMRIVTWNVERGRRGGPRNSELINAVMGLRADICVLTEVPAALDLPGMVAIRSCSEGGEPCSADVWVAVYLPNDSDWTALDLPVIRTAAAVKTVIDGRALFVYGTVLPWRGSGEYLPVGASDGKTGPALFEHVLDEQVVDIERLTSSAPERTMIWAGDFNQTLAGPNWGGSERGRVALRRALSRLDLVAWTADAPHQDERLRSIDHICGPAATARPSLAVARPTNRRRDTFISDHACYVVSI